ncbi:MAG TPA: hypothetical protein VF281_04920 [Candidatus Saccharimonadales bacterium]
MEDDSIYIDSSTPASKKLAALERVERIATLIAIHTPFEVDSFAPQPTTRKVFRRPSSWLYKWALLYPVAFRANVRILESAEGISAAGGMDPYIWLMNGTQLIRQEKSKHVHLDPKSLTRQDIYNLEIGIQGDYGLVMKEYTKIVEDRIYSLNWLD